MSKKIGLFMVIIILSAICYTSYPEFTSSSRITISRDIIPIYDIFQFQNISIILDSDYVIKNNIDATITRTWNNGSGFQPIGDETNPFTGKLDGQGYTIINLFLNQTDESNIAPFHTISNSGSINNLNIKNITVNGDEQVSGLVANLNSDSWILNCTVSGNIHSERINMGGICAESDVDTKIINTSFFGLLEGRGEIGGITGENWGMINKCEVNASLVNTRLDLGDFGGISSDNNGNVENCSSEVEIDIRGGDAGGLIGENIHGVVKFSWSKCNINTNNRAGRIGGLVGNNNHFGEVLSSFSICNISGRGAIGGLIGANEGSVMNCYSISKLSGDDPIGGLIGRNRENPDNIVKNCLAVPLNINGEIFGGFTGNNTGSIINCFFDNSTINISTGEGSDIGINPMSSENMYETLTYTENNWDFNNVWNNYPGRSYPYLQWEIMGDLNINPMTNTHYFEDNYLEYNFTFSSSVIDQEIDYYWNFESNAYFLDFDIENGTIKGQLTNNNTGSYFINVSLYGYKLSPDNINISIDILNVNDPPIILFNGSYNLTEDQFFSEYLEYFDIDPTEDNLVWSVESTNSDFIQFNTETGMLAGLPDNSDVGNWWIVLNLSDGNGGFNQINITIVVENVNDDPVIQKEYIEDIFEDEPFYWDIDAIDIDPTNDHLTWNLNTHASFLDVNKTTGNISGSPSNDEVGPWWANITVNDGRGGYDWYNFTFNVINVNDSPVIILDDYNFTTQEDTILENIELETWFIDIDGDTLTYSFAISNHTIITIENSSMSIQPMSDWFGTEIISIFASDGISIVTLNISLIVDSVNDPPIDLKIIANSSYYLDEAQIFKAESFDNDFEYGDSHTYSWSSNISGDLKIGDSITVNLPVGVHNVTLIVTDTEGASSQTSMEIEILPNPEEEPSNNGIGIELMVTIAILLIIAIIIIFFIIRRKKESNLTEE